MSGAFILYEFIAIIVNEMNLTILLFLKFIILCCASFMDNFLYFSLNYFLTLFMLLQSYNSSDSKLDESQETVIYDPDEYLAEVGKNVH